MRRSWLAIILRYKLIIYTLTVSDNNYFKTCQANGNKENGFEVPVPQVLLNTIGQTHKFNVKVTEHNVFRQDAGNNRDEGPVPICSTIYTRSSC